MGKKYIYTGISRRYSDYGRKTKKDGKLNYRIGQIFKWEKVESECRKGNENVL